MVQICKSFIKNTKFKQIFHIFPPQPPSFYTPARHCFRPFHENSTLAVSKTEKLFKRIEGTSNKLLHFIAQLSRKEMKKSFEKHKIVISLCVTTFYYPRNNKIQIYDVISEDLSCFKLFACKDANYELSLRIDLGNKQISSGVCLAERPVGDAVMKFRLQRRPKSI